MKIQNWFTLLLVLGVLNVNLMLAQQYPFETLGKSEGLPANKVNEVLQTENGFYYLATEGAGLLRYDGYTFVSLTRDLPQPKLFIYSLAKDAKENLWFGSEAGLIFYNGTEFTTVYASKPNLTFEELAFTGDTVFALSQKGKLYKAASANDTLQLASNQTFTHVGVVNKRLLLSTQQALTGERNATIDSLSTMQIDANKDTALVLTNTKICRFWRNTLVQTKPLKLPNSKAFATYKNTLAYTNGTSVVLSKNGQEIVLSKKNGLPNQQYTKLYFDLFGTLWAVGENSLVKLPSISSVQWPLPAKTNTSAVATYKGSNYVASPNKLWKVNETRDTILPIKSPQFGTVQALVPHQNNLFLATERGLYTYNGTSFSRINIGGLYANFIFSLLSTGDDLWIGTGQGLYKYNNGRIDNLQAQQNLPNATVYALSHSPDGALWCATYTNGFFRFFNGRWELQAAKSLNLALDSLQINTFVAESREVLWVATAAQGLVRVTPNNKFQLTSNRLNFAEITALQYNQNSLWVGSSKGLYEIYPDPVNQSDYFIYEHELKAQNDPGLVGVKSNALKITDHGFICASGSGLFALENTNKQLIKPKLQLTNIELFFGNVDNIKTYAQSTQPFANIPAQVELPYNLNFLNFTLSGISPVHQNNLRYRYRLRNRDEGEWTNAGNRREAVFSNLKPNNYTFEAQTSTDGKNWSSPLLSYSFTIKTPYYQTWWFISVLVLAAGSLVYVFVHERVRRINQRLVLENKLMNMERKALRLQMNPHFIFNALDSVSSFIFKKDPKQAVRYLNNFAKLMRLTLESSMEHLHPVETEVSILKNYLELEKLRFNSKFTFVIEVDEEIDYDIGIPPMLIQPHVENAILHGIKPMEGEGIIAIRFLLNGNFLVCEIEDNGIGRKAAKELGNRKAHRSMATKINKDRIRLLKESLNDAISIDIIDKFDSNKQASGTLVRIRLVAEEI